MYLFKIIRKSDGKLIGQQENEDINYQPEIPVGYDLENDNYEIKRDLKPIYKEKRLEEYGDIGAQLDEIFHDVDAWKVRIQAVKDKFPKN